MRHIISDGMSGAVIAIKEVSSSVMFEVIIFRVSAHPKATSLVSAHPQAMMTLVIHVLKQWRHWSVHTLKQWCHWSFTSWFCCLRPLHWLQHPFDAFTRYSAYVFNLKWSTVADLLSYVKRRTIISYTELLPAWTRGIYLSLKQACNQTSDMPCSNWNSNWYWNDWYQ